MSIENSQKLALFRYFLIPFAIFLTVVPTGILSLSQHYQQKGVVTYTTIISQEEFPQKIDTSGGGIVLTPNLTLSGDFICVMCAWIISLIGIFDSLRKNNLIGQFISIFLIAFTVLQTLSAIYTVIFSDQWIFEILSGSWQKAYLLDSELIKEIQYEFSCQGYVSVNDRPANTHHHQFDESCSKMLINRFGTQLFDVAKIILLIRFVQLFGVLIHAHIFNRLILHDIMMYAEEECYVEEEECYVEEEECYVEEECYSDADYDDEYYDNYISNSEEQDDDNSYISSPTSPLLLSKIYFG